MQFEVNNHFHHFRFYDNELFLFEVNNHFRFYENGFFLFIERCHFAAKTIFVLYYFIRQKLRTREMNLLWSVDEGYFPDNKE